MPRLKTLPTVDVPRRDTLSLRTIVRHDRNTRRPTTPILVGKYVVARRPLIHSLYTEYLILDGAEIAAKQISYPSEDDCASAVKRLREAQRAAKLAAEQAIGAAKRTSKRRSRKAAKEIA